jgi:DNA-3-methyladenine glycosylase II
MPDAVFRTAHRHLARNCPVMRRLTEAVGPCTLEPQSGDPFTVLVRCVIAQQISTKAARSISEKLVAAVGGAPLTPAKIAGLTEACFKECGISGPKRRTLRALAEYVTAHPVLLPGLPDSDDDTIRARLTAITGIGPWTADMFLIFGLGRPDVLAVGDYGIRVAVRNEFRLRKLPDAAQLTRIARPWEPYRTVACWYLWRSLEFAGK